MFGFSFLNSVFLWGLAAATLPVVIHLIKRDRAVKVPFAAIRFLQEDPDKKFKSERLKQILLLLLRITALAILALAFARPFLSGEQAATFWGQQSQAAVILVDNSYSMGVGDNFKIAVGQAKDLLSDFRIHDEVEVVQFAEKLRKYHDSGYFRRIGQWLDR